MWMQPHRLLSAILMLLVGYFLLNATMKSPVSIDQAPQRNAHPLALFAEGIHTRQFDSQGLLTQTVTGSRLEQREGVSDTTLTNPRVQFDDDGAITWTVTAKQGAYDNLETFQLSQQVVVQNSGNKPVTIHTDNVALNTLSGFVSTKDAVTMTTQQGKLDAVGMTFDTHREIIQFHANVQTYYEANNE